MQILLQIRDYGFDTQVIQEPREVSLDQSQCQRDLSCNRKSIFLVFLAFLAACIERVPEHVHRSDFV